MDTDENKDTEEEAGTPPADEEPDPTEKLDEDDADPDEGDEAEEQSL